MNAITSFSHGFADGVMLGLKLAASAGLLGVVALSAMLSIWGVFAAPYVMETGMDAIWGGDDHEN